MSTCWVVLSLSATPLAALGLVSLSHFSTNFSLVSMVWLRFVTVVEPLVPWLSRSWTVWTKPHGDLIDLDDTLVHVP